LTYFFNQYDALNSNNAQAYSYTYIVGNAEYGNIAFAAANTRWMISSNSFGSSTGIVTNGEVLVNDGSYFLYPEPLACFLEGTNILCQIYGVDTYVPIENMKRGTLVKTSKNGYKKVELIGKGTIYNNGNEERTKNRLYKCSPTNYPELNSNLFITGCHSILTNSLTEKHREQTLQDLGKIYVTENMYRLMACIDERAKPWESEGTYTIWHFALENKNYYSNYGVYANGLLVETCSKRYLKELSNLTLTDL
jgi:hypothetical protein